MRHRYQSILDSSIQRGDSLVWCTGTELGILPSMKARKPGLNAKDRRGAHYQDHPLHRDMKLYDIICLHLHSSIFIVKQEKCKEMKNLRRAHVLTKHCYYKILQLEKYLYVKENIIKTIWLILLAVPLLGIDRIPTKWHPGLKWENDLLPIQCLCFCHISQLCCLLRYRCIFEVKLF